MNVLVLKKRVDLAFLLFIIILLGLGSSCSGHKPVVFVDPALPIINKHQADNDIQGLLEDCRLYPNFANGIRQYLLYEVDYSKMPESQLLQISNKMQGDSLLKLGFESIIVRRHQKQGDVQTVISDFKNSENYSAILRNYLLNEVDYSTTVYLDLCKYSTLSSFDTILSQGYYYKALKYENRIYQKLQGNQLNKVLGFYFKNEHQLPFLQQLIKSSVVDNLGEYDYKHLRAIKEMLSKSCFSDVAYSYYANKKASQKPYVESSLLQLKKSEEQLQEQVIKLLRVELSLYVGRHVANIIQDCGKQKYPSNHEEINAKFEEILSTNINMDSLRYMISKSVVEMQKCINNSRNNYYHQLTGDDLSEYLFMDYPNLADIHFPKDFDLSGLYQIASIQNQFDATGAAWGVGGFLLGLVSGGLGLLATAASAMHSYDKGKSDAEQEGVALKQFASSFMNKIDRMQNQIIGEIKKDITANRVESFTEFEKAVYENY